jgi:hypothetical protein
MFILHWIAVNSYSALLKYSRHLISAAFPPISYWQKLKTDRQLNQLHQPGDYSLTERQFDQLPGRSKMYQYLSVRYIETCG